MKKLLLCICMLFMLCSCDNKEEDEKNDYLAYKSQLQESKTFKQQEDLPCKVTISLDRVNEEEISYRAILDNPKENMYNVKAMIIHNNFTEDIFPSIGIFDESENLIIGSEEVKGIELVGYIETTKAIKNLNLEIKVWIEYTNESGEQKEIFYKVME